MWKCYYIILKSCFENHYRMASLLYLFILLSLSQFLSLEYIINNLSLCDYVHVQVWMMDIDTARSSVYKTCTHWVDIKVEKNRNRKTS